MMRKLSIYLFKMVFYNLTIGKYNIKYTPLKVEDNDYPNCDKDGNLLNKVVEGKRESYFLDDKGNKHLNSFKLINGIARAKLDKTKSVTTFKEVEKNEVEDLLTEKEYYVECEFLLEELKNTNKALKFGFTNGNGYKVFIGYIYVDNLYNMLFMKLGRTQKSQLMIKILEAIKNKKAIEKTQVTINGVDKAQVEDLIQI